jgi:hypothetical protein
VSSPSVEPPSMLSSPSVDPPSMLTLIMSTTTVLIFNSNSPFPLADVLGFVLGHKWASDQSLVRSIIGRLSGSSPFPRAAQYPGGDRGPAPGAAGREFLLQLPDPFMLTQRAGPQPTRTPNARCRNDPDPAPGAGGVRVSSRSWREYSYSPSARRAAARSRADRAESAGAGLASRSPRLCSRRNRGAPRHST